jgi:hypothetical protein
MNRSYRTDGQTETGAGIGRVAPRLCGMARGAVMILLVFAAPAANAAAPEPGPAIDYAPLAFYPDRWRELGIEPMLHPWPARTLVLLTPAADLDRGTMEIFLGRLDAGWEHYAALVGVEPGRHKLLDGRTTIAAVPDGRLTCGIGCGRIGVTGIEVAGFDRDFALVKESPAAFPHYYFYEMGRNWYVFGDRHSSFITGYAVFMRYSCMDAAGCEDPEARLRAAIERAEAAHAAGEMDFLRAFTMQGGLTEKQPRLAGFDGPCDQPVLYASAMLKLRRDRGGDAWTKRFFAALLQCPAVPADTPAGALAQCRAWLVAASVAARRDLSDVFCDRWRLPLLPAARKVLAAIDWEAADLDAAQILAGLPAE